LDPVVKVISWNLLRLEGARAADVAALIERHQPDLVLMQEATAEIDGLPGLVGGNYFRYPLPGRKHGLAAWSHLKLSAPDAVLLPFSRMPGCLPQKIAQVVRIAGVSIANVHLSHGQVMNRRQLMELTRAIEGPAALMGDYNAVGPTLIPGFRDVGPRGPTHRTADLVPVRLDRCIVRGLSGHDAEVLARGPSDHHPIAVRLLAA
jgi:endonuclease/exonuclease/phosphatase (EEP) superfamily protein YafD